MSNLIIDEYKETLKLKNDFEEQLNKMEEIVKKRIKALDPNGTFSFDVRFYIDKICIDCYPIEDFSLSVLENIKAELGIKSSKILIIPCEGESFCIVCNLF